LETFTIIATIVSYGILMYFVIRFYLNYKRIQATDSAKVLMQNILKTRKTVRYYVWTILGFLTLSTILLVGYLAIFTDTYIDRSSQEQIPIYLILIITIIVLAFAMGAIALVYRLVYGILTRKLKRNYDELEKLEI